MLEALNIIFVILSIIGNEFVRRRDRRGWWAWLPGNLLAVTFFSLRHEWWTALLYGYFSCTSWLALRDWRRLEQRNDSSAVSPPPRGLPEQLPQ